MGTPSFGFRKILAAIDFSSHSRAAAKQAAWVARANTARLVLAHCLRDLRHAVHATSYQAKLSLLHGEDDLLQREMRRESDQKLRALASEIGAGKFGISIETLLGEPYVELTHAVEAEGYDLVVAGTRGMAAWEEFLLGSTAKRLIRKCPASVWVVKDDHADPPRTVLAGTDFSAVSLKAVKQGLAVARQAGAEFHLLYVVDSMDVPEEVAANNPRTAALRGEINNEATTRLAALVQSELGAIERSHVHVTWGTPWKEIRRMGSELHADLVVMGTVGRCGIKGLLLGNTAERVLGTCSCSLLTVKPDGFVSPIAPATWPLHP